MVISMNNIEWRNAKKSNIEMIEEVERHFGIKFPKDFIECVLENDGGYPSHNVFFLNGREESINNLLSIENNKYKGMVNTAQSVLDRLNENIVPFGEDAGGNLICFDYRYGTSPSIVFWDHEKAFMEADDAVIKIAETFTQFLDCLQIFKD